MFLEGDIPGKGGEELSAVVVDSVWICPRPLNIDVVSLLEWLRSEMDALRTAEQTFCSCEDVDMAVDYVLRNLSEIDESLASICLAGLQNPMFQLHRETSTSMPPPLASLMGHLYRAAVLVFLICGASIW